MLDHQSVDEVTNETLLPLPSILPEMIKEEVVDFVQTVDEVGKEDESTVVG